MSDKANAGGVNRKKGSDATVDINDSISVELPNMFMSHVAAVSCADTQVPEIRLDNHSMRYTGLRSAVNVDDLVIGRGGMELKP
jgi:hypothetical protein